jgi:peroxiredoxin
MTIRNSPFFGKLAILGLAMTMSIQAAPSKGQVPQADRISIAAGADSAAALSASLQKLGFTVLPSPVKVDDFSLPALAGGPAKLSGQRGKVVLLNFWATWCPPCQKEMPAIDSLWGKMRGTNFTIMGVSLGEELSTVRKYIDAKKYSYPIYLDRQGKTGSYFGARSIPMTWIIDKEGMALAYVVGDIADVSGKAYDSPELVSLLGELASK